MLYPLAVSFHNDKEVSKGINDWRIYLSPEGFPYYYNHITDQSEWALFESPVNMRAAGDIISEPIVAATVSVPTAELAGLIARNLISQRLAACAQILPPMTSVYAWKGNIEESNEVMMVLKVNSILCGK